MIADSGNIFATDKPFPTQKASTPPSAYIFTIVLAIVRMPDMRAGVPAPTGSEGLVIKNTFIRSKGAVHVRETDRGGFVSISFYRSSFVRTGSSNTPSK